ncbi:Mfa1 family fimbria major subunit [Parabacteroides chongii]|uniref:Mfa1 family fimbria major subunit n=1 Tax=Parabacteroides chongii TaxID=2685834 RepID=UPI00240D75ED|nr:Mfa1 family fimbria major subunit [Parabacteroides chongii]WFE84391.1 Mfa1 family fimbria major subunit [Parabacteroides chongii]
MKLRNIFAVALAGLAFTACNNDDVPGKGTDGNGAEKTFIGLTIQLPKGTVTKGATDAAGTANENRLKTLHIYCWTGMNIGTPTTVDIDTEATADASGGYTVNAAIEGVVGANNIFVTANTAAPITGLTAAGVTHDTPQELTQTLASLIDETGGGEGFVMFSKDIVEVNAAAAAKADVEAGSVATNIAAVTLRRAVAKVALTSSLTSTDGTGIDDEGGFCKIYDVKWNIANQPATLYPVVKFAAGLNFEAGNIISPYTNFDPNLDPTEAVPAIGEAAALQYCKENAHGSANDYTNQNTTTIQVMAICSPKTYYKEVTDAGSGKFTATTANNLAKGTTFYTLKAADGELAANSFFDETAAGQYATIKGGDKATYFNEYKDGKCYWTIYIHNGATPKVYGVLRNNLYTVNINSIKAPGFPALPIDNTPIASEAWIQTTIAVEPWTANAMGDVDLQ